MIASINARAKLAAAGALPLTIETVEVDHDCTGARWIAQDETQLARLIAIIAMGQAVYAAHVLSALLPAAPKFSTESLRREAIIKLTIQEEKQEPRKGYPQWQRDGFIFEAISWIAARQKHGERGLIMEPHVKSTSQGIDGLLLRLSQDKSKIADVTICEDTRCVQSPSIGSFQFSTDHSDHEQTDTSSNDGPGLMSPELTWQGHEMLATLRSKPVCEKIKGTAQEKGIELSFDTVITLAKRRWLGSSHRRIEASKRMRSNPWEATS